VTDRQRIEHLENAVREIHRHLSEGPDWVWRYPIAEAVPDPKAEAAIMPDNDVIFGPPRPDASLAPEVHPRPFRVGDVVRLKPGCVPMFNDGTGPTEWVGGTFAREWTGPSEITELYEDGDFFVVGGVFHPSCLELVTPAAESEPEPARAWPKRRAMSEDTEGKHVLLFWKYGRPTPAWSIGVKTDGGWEVVGQGCMKADSAFLGWLPLPTMEETE